MIEARYPGIFTYGFDSAYAYLDITPLDQNEKPLTGLTQSFRLLSSDYLLNGAKSAIAKACDFMLAAQGPEN